MTLCMQKKLGKLCLLLRVVSQIKTNALNVLNASTFHTDIGPNNERMN